MAIIALMINGFILILNFMAHENVVVFTERSYQYNIKVQINVGTVLRICAPNVLFLIRNYRVRKALLTVLYLLSEEFRYSKD